MGEGGQKARTSSYNIKSSGDVMYSKVTIYFFSKERDERILYFINL